MRSRPLITLRLNTAPIQNIGATPHGARVTFPITGGFFEGERLRGKVLLGGDDWTVKRSDGAIELDLRVTLETDDGDESKGRLVLRRHECLRTSCG
jgi:hypothetical protein